MVIFPSMTSIKEIENKKNPEELTLHSFFMSSEPRPGSFSTKLKGI